MRYNFQIDNVQVVSNNSDSQFATLEVDIARSGKNTHRMPITREGIRASVPSVHNKPILAAFNWAGNDFEGHEPDEIPVGFFEDNVKTVEKDGELYLRATGKIWKRYFSNVMDIFKRKGAKTDVSAELEVLDGKEPTPVSEGSINLFSLLGCTLLGVNPAIKGAEARVLSFSEIIDEYNKESSVDIDKFADKRKQFYNMVQKVDTSKEAMDNGEWNGDKAKQDAIKAKNFVEIAPKIFLRLEEGWQDREITKLDYPIMILKGDVWVYSRKGLSSALSYAKQENETEVIGKLESIYKDLGLNEEGGGKESMAEIKDKMLEEALENKEDEIIENSDDIDTPDPTDDDDREDVKDGEGDDSEAEEFEAEAEIEQEDECVEKGFAQIMAELLECETHDARIAYRESLEHAKPDENIVMDKLCDMCDVIAELKEFRANVLKDKTAFEVSQILASVKPNIEKNCFAELEERAKEIKFEEIDSFRLEAKAFAFDHASQSVDNQDEIIRMGIDTKDTNTKNVFDRILGE